MAIELVSAGWETILHEAAWARRVPPAGRLPVHQARRAQRLLEDGTAQTDRCDHALRPARIRRPGERPVRASPPGAARGARPWREGTAHGALPRRRRARRRHLGRNLPPTPGCAATTSWASRSATPSWCAAARRTSRSCGSALATTSCRSASPCGSRRLTHTCSRRAARRDRRAARRGSGRGARGAGWRRGVERRRRPGVREVLRTGERARDPRVSVGRTAAQHRCALGVHVRPGNGRGASATATRCTSRA